MRLQLEAGDFEDGPGVVGAVVDEGDDGDADVAADERGQAGLRRGFRRSGVVVVVLPLEPVMATILPLRKRAASSSSPMIGQAEVAHLHQFRGVERHAGADHDQVLAAEGQQAVTAGFDHDALFEQGGNLFGQRLGAAHVGDGDLCALPAQKQRGGQAGLAQADDQYFFAFEFHHVFSIPCRPSRDRRRRYCAHVDRCGRRARR